MTPYFRFTFFTIIAIIVYGCSGRNIDLKKVAIWDALTLDFEGPEVSELDEFNPFLNYGLEVLFTDGEQSFVVPGYFAADGNAGETSSDNGNIWRVKFTPNKIGIWNYSVSFKKGKNISINPDKSAGESIGDDGKEGQFEVVMGKFDKIDFRSKGRLKHNNESPYQQFQGTKDYFIKGGPDSPENLLAYEDFDGTYGYDSTRQFIKNYEPHIKDWKAGDPIWKDNKGKGLIGALNYISEKGMNVVYFLTMNIEGDGRDVWMYRNHKDFTRFDCSKLDQWEIVFNHAQSKGIMLHFVTQETENELLLDNGDLKINRQLYYRELIARFAHHPAIIWNMGEENGPAGFSPNGQTSSQQKAMFQYFKENDPYQNLVMLHTHSTKAEKEKLLPALLGDMNLDGLSAQINSTADVHDEILKWKKNSKERNKEWIIYMDEIGPYWKGVMPDVIDMHHDTIRKEVLWGSLMAGAAGIEWYFGYKFLPADLDCQDWRSRDVMWDQTRFALEFFQKYIPFWEMSSRDELVVHGNAYCFTKPSEAYVFYIPNTKQKMTIDLSEIENSAIIGNWYNPRKGGDLMNSFETKALKLTNIEFPEENKDNDWVLLIKIK